jgi:hypothetical protein
LKFTEELLLRYIKVNEYEKPKLEIGSYYLQWDEKSYGINNKELFELKGFLTNVIPYFDITYQLINSLERPKSKERFVMNKRLSPDIHFSHRNKEGLVSYDLYMKSNGSTLIDRTEKIQIIKKDSNKFSTPSNVSITNFGKSELSLKSKLGELLFNRQGRSGLIRNKLISTL